MMLQKKKAKMLVCLHGSVLVIDLTRARESGVVSLDLRTRPFAYFHTQNTAAGVTLGYADEKGAFTPIAVFASADDASDVCGQITQTLLARGRFLQRARKIVLVLAVILGTLWALDGLLSMLVPSGNGQADIEAASTSAPRSGMPVDADSQFKPAGE